MTQARLLLMQALLCHPVLKVTTINSANPTVPIFGATVGIGQKTALNYKWNNYKADEAKTRAQQFNIMYKVLPGISAYAGYLNADTSGDFGGKTKNSGQIGLQAAYDIPALFTVWGNVGYGNRNSGYEIGISKPILNNLEVNASYYNQTFDDAFGEDLDMKAKGVNLSLTLQILICQQQLTKLK